MIDYDDDGDDAYYDCGAIDGMRVSYGEQKHSRKPAPTLLCPLKFQYDLTRARTQAAAVESLQLTA
jgi:hypothetical protein